MKYYKKLTGKQKAISAGIIIVSVILILTVYLTNKPKYLILKNNNVTIEYGQTISKELTDYLNIDKLSKKDKEKVLSNAVLTLEATNEKDKEYPAIGDYEAVITYKKETKKVKISVKDTTSPVFQKLNEKTGKYEELAVAYETYKDVPLTPETFNVFDLSAKVTVTLDESNVDYSATGEYILKVTAEDISKNTSTLEVKVTVKEPTIELDQTSMELTKGDSKKISATVHGKEETITYASSDENIASVSKDGEVTAKNTGTVTITVTANGVETKCKVSIKAKTVTPINKSSSNSKRNIENIPSNPTSLNANTVGYLKAAQYSDNIMIVSANTKSNTGVTVSYYKKTGETWIESFNVAGTVGSKGIGKTKEGDGKTPIGIYSITKLFGLNSNPGTKLSYHQLTGSEYWCGDKFYNQWVDEKYTDHSGCNKKIDEHLASYPVVYDYVAALNYNPGNIYGAGSAIFVHCQRRPGALTGGCVAIPKAQMIEFMRSINTSTRVIIDTENNIFNY